ncbi:MAG: hypothetical protein ACRDPV_12945 [Gaiellaceae bacterium]
MKRRPTIGRELHAQLWENQQDYHRRVKPNFDPTTDEAGAAWEAALVVAGRPANARPR